MTSNSCTYNKSRITEAKHYLYVDDMICQDIQRRFNYGVTKKISFDMITKEFL